jgi:hypothetical protein
MIGRATLPMLARRNVHAHGVAVMNHHPVAADVDPTVIGIAGNHHMAGANVSPTIALMPKRHREFE